MHTKQIAALFHGWKTSAVFCSGTLWLLVGVGGCSQHPTRLAHQIASADRIVATNQGTVAKVVVAGEEAKRIAAAVASAKRDGNHYSAVFAWHLQFYSGTNLLAAIRLQDQVFKTKDAQYNDETGVLKAFYLGDLTEAEGRISEKTAAENLPR